jgi:hypothetical protein
MAADAMEALAGRYADRAVRSVFIYTREAHPGENYGHHRTIEDKRRNARAFLDHGGIRRAAAVEFGVSEQLIRDLVDDPQSAAADAKLKPVLAYLRKLTLTPTQMTQQDADAVFAAGWDQRALYDAIQICCLYNFMNRFVEGLGLTPIPDQFEMEGKMIRGGGYKGMLDAFGIK